MSTAAEVIDDTFSATERQIMRTAFKIFDKNKDGTIDPCEFGTLLQAIGCNPTKNQIWDTLRQFDKNGDGVIDFEEFVIMSRCFRECRKENLEDDLRQAFRVFDRNGDGYISAEELRCVVTRTGDTLSQEEAEELIRMIDKDGDGKLVYEEFVVIAKKSVKECIQALEQRKEETSGHSHHQQQHHHHQQQQQQQPQITLTNESDCVGQINGSSDWDRSPQKTLNLDDVDEARTN